MTKCWCEHSEGLHKTGICVACARWEIKVPSLNWTPHHTFDPRAETSSELSRQRVEAYDALLRGEEVVVRNEALHPAIIMHHLGFSSLSYTVRFLRRPTRSAK